METHLAINEALRLPDPLLNLGQHVRILHGKHRSVSGRVIACEWNGSQNDWNYFVKAAENELGPYTAGELN